MNALGRRPLLGAGLYSIFVSKLAKAQRSSRHVHTALCVCADTSGSVDASEYALQNQGLAAALLQNSVRETLELRGPLAFALTEFDIYAFTRMPWRVLTTQNDLEDLSQQIRGMRRMHNGGTHVDVGVSFAMQTLMNSNITANHRVIDVSGDEFSEHVRGGCMIVKEAAQDEGIRINTLPITEPAKAWSNNAVREQDNARLVTAFREQVQTIDGFTQEAEGFQDFAESMARKLRYEYAGLRPPRTVRLG